MSLKDPPHKGTLPNRMGWRTDRVGTSLCRRATHRDPRLTCSGESPGTSETRDSPAQATPGLATHLLRRHRDPRLTCSGESRGLAGPATHLLTRGSVCRLTGDGQILKYLNLSRGSNTCLLDETDLIIMVSQAYFEARWLRQVDQSSKLIRA